MTDMPEMPEVEALTRLLDRRMAGRRVERCELASFSALKTVAPPIVSLTGRVARGCRRRGKYLCLDFDGLWLVAHLGRAGWVRWYDGLPPRRARPTGSPLGLRVGLSSREDEGCGPGFDVTEAGTQKRLSLWVVEAPSQVEGIATLGMEPLDPALDTDALAGLLKGAGGTVKSALSTQSLLAGVGNAYSDEALHAARLSPFKLARNLTALEVEALRLALVGVLREAVARADGLDPAALKAEKRRSMRVHGRAGEACPVCHDTVRAVAFATRSLQYCPTCQTGGRPLADRRLSRLLK